MHVSRDLFPCSTSIVLSTLCMCVRAASSLLDDITAVVTSGDVTNLNKIISAVEGGKAQQNNVVTVRSDDLSMRLWFGWHPCARDTDARTSNSTALPVTPSTARVDLHGRLVRRLVTVTAMRAWVQVVTKTILGNKSALDVGGIVTLLVGLPVAVVVQILAGLTAPICIQILLGCCNQVRRS